MTTQGGNKPAADFTRTLGRSGVQVSALGLGCWAIGGPWQFEGSPAGWSVVEDDESVRAIHRALELGVTFFDTAANYGAGHSERILARAVRGRRQDVVLATKFGYRVDEARRQVVHYDGVEADGDVASRLARDLEASLARLETDYVDVYLLHVGGLSIERALEAQQVLERLVERGSIRTYGWSTDRVDAVRAFAAEPGCGVVEQQLSIFDGNEDLLSACEELRLGSINRGPLGMGLLTGKFTSASTFATDGVRREVQWHPGFRGGNPTQEWLDKIDAVRDVLTSGGRTLAQGALAWLWARSDCTVPIPGFRTVQQVEDNGGALALGPLSPAQMTAISELLGDSADSPAGRH
jgi:aryl-alcohol dehydrogenase-like predicted oxidoreductase